LTVVALAGVALAVVAFAAGADAFTAAAFAAAGLAVFAAAGLAVVAGLVVAAGLVPALGAACFGVFVAAGLAAARVARATRTLAVRLATVVTAAARAAVAALAVAAFAVAAFAEALLTVAALARAAREPELAAPAFVRGVVVVFEVLVVADCRAVPGRCVETFPVACFSGVPTVRRLVPRAEGRVDAVPLPGSDPSTRRRSWWSELMHLTSVGGHCRSTPGERSGTHVNTPLLIRDLNRGVGTHGLVT
jgi:hypothetical protein